MNRIENCKRTPTTTALSAVALALFALVPAACSPNKLRVLETPRLATGERKVVYEHGGVLMGLRSGMRLLVLPDDGTNLIQIDVRYTVGSRADPPGRSGLAHLIEHLTFQARPPALDQIIDQVIGDIVLYNNASTSWHTTQYTAVASSDQLERLMTIEALRMQVSCEHIDEALFAREREVVRNEIRERTTVGSQAAELFLRDVYGEDHPYSQRIGGSDTDVAAISRDDVCAFLDAHYQPENAIMVLSGAVDLERAKQLFGRLFGKIPGKPVVRDTAIAPPRLRGTSSEHTLPVLEATALIAYNAPAPTSDRSGYERLAQHLLMKRLREVKSDNPAINELELHEIGGHQAPLLVIEVSVDNPAHLRAVVARIQNRTSHLLSRVDNDELGHLKELVRTGFMRSIEDFGNEAELFLDYLHYAENTEYAIAELNQYARMTRSTFTAYTDTRFRKEESHVVYFMPGAKSSPSARRAALTFTPSADDPSDWRASVDVSEAARDLPLPGARTRPKMRTFQLKNGLEVVLVPDLGHPVVDMRLVFRGGTLHAPADNPELALWAAELLKPNREVLLERTVTIERVRALVRAIQRMGIPLRISVTETTTTFHSVGLSMYADGILWRLYHLAYTGTYDAEFLSYARKKIRSDDEESRTLTRRARDALMSAVYGAGHEYARERTEREQLERLSIRDLERFRDTHYRADGATLIIAGEFDESFLVPEIRRLFGKLDTGSTPTPRSVESPAPRRSPIHLALVDETTAQLNISIAFPTSAGETQRLAQRLVLRELARLEFSALRERLGASYGVSVAFRQRMGPGLLLIDADVDPERAAEAYRELRATLERIRTGDIQPSFVRARRTVLRKLLASSVDSKTVADELELAWRHDSSEDLWTGIARQVATMRLDDVRALIGEELTEARSVTLMTGSAAAIDAAYDSVGVSPSRVR